MQELYWVASRLSSIKHVYKKLVRTSKGPKDQAGLTTASALVGGGFSHMLSQRLGGAT